MDLAAGEVPDEPGVHRAEAELAALGPCACTGHVLQNPADLGGAEIGVDDKAGLEADLISQAEGLEAVTVFAGAAVLPDYGVIDRFAGGGVPHHGRLTLVGDAYAGDVQTVDSQLSNGLRDDRGLAGPDLPGVVLDPAWFWEMLCKFFLCHAPGAPLVVKYYRP